MIHWMQKHKRWLVITIWISTIAFVGAGFVGWGSYSYGKNSGSVIATVGDLEIDFQEMQKEYNMMYGQYQQMFGNNFNQEMAAKLNLEQQAYKNLIQKYLILNLAHKYGIIATNEDVAKELVKYQAFIKNGKFDKESYLKILQQNGTNPTDFESAMKNDIVFYKTISIFNSTLDQKELKTLTDIYFSEDEVSINIIDSNSIDKSFDEKELRAFWEVNKNNYKTIMKYKVKIEKISIENDEKVAKNNALKKYLTLKNNKEDFTKEELLDDHSILFGNNLKDITALKVGAILKPFRIENEFIIVKMIEKISPVLLTFEQANAQVKSDFLRTIASKRMEKRKEELLKNFSGTNIGFIGKETKPQINGLTNADIDKLIQDIGVSTSTLNASALDNKIVVYKIESSRLTEVSKEKTIGLSQSIEKMKNEEILMSLLSKLEKEYEVKSNMKVNKSE